MYFCSKSQPDLTRNTDFRGGIAFTLPKPWISIKVLGISNQKFRNTKFFTP